MWKTSSCKLLIINDYNCLKIRILAGIYRIFLSFFAHCQCLMGFRPDTIYLKGKCVDGVPFILTARIVGLYQPFQINRVCHNLVATGDHSRRVLCERLCGHQFFLSAPLICDTLKSIEHSTKFERSPRCERRASTCRRQGREKKNWY